MTETTDRRGRVRVWLGYGHPYANSGGWQWRNRLRLAMKLGRALQPHEDAHHVNEDLTDDRPENLELRTHRRHASEHAKARERDERGRFVRTLGRALEGAA